ncbi:metallophosphoesterase [Labilibaculum sp. DW002]|uniref:Metallophosphoesterase n=1 Tax=Paralabilibaculum antarcticum TaxID=2912572 RepID=A0ABT5VPX0_9BACT|nr:metallophosphoesterase [Labilibaculum sp. DW002]MDE5417300.1 metallophosphoesterase [Labilibaculum sp. DW002]
MYDIIGDIHGEANTLKHMLLSLDYVEGEEGYFHPERKAVFVGDFVDRGPDIFETLSIVRKMVTAGNAFAVVGNHELNVLAYYTKDEDGLFLREHSLKNRTQIKKTYEEFKLDKPKRKSYLKWLRSLPLFLEFDNFRIVHACWDQDAIDLLKKENPENCLNKQFLRKIYFERGKLFKATMLLLKGREFNFPDDMILKDAYGFKRSAYRIKWWEPMEGKSFEDISFGNRFHLPEYTIPSQLCKEIPLYPETELPVFFGHYCLGDNAGLVRNNLCCVDGCVANGGILVAYRMDAKELKQNNIISVKKVRSAQV